MIVQITVTSPSSLQLMVAVTVFFSSLSVKRRVRLLLIMVHIVQIEVVGVTTPGVMFTLHHQVIYVPVFHPVKTAAVT